MPLASSTRATAVETATIAAARPYFHRVPALSRSGKSTRRATTQRHVESERGQRGQRHGVRRVRVHQSIVPRRDLASQPPRAPADRAPTPGRNRRTSSPAFARASRERLAGPRRDERPVAAPRQLGGEPQRLSLAAAPAALGVDVQHVDAHGAQLPLSRRATQGSPTMTRRHEQIRRERDPDRRARQPRRSRLRVGAHATAPRALSRRDDRRLVQGIHAPTSRRSFRTSRDGHRRRSILGRAPPSRPRPSLAAFLRSVVDESHATLRRRDPRARRRGEPPRRSRPRGIPVRIGAGAPPQRAVSHARARRRRTRSKPVLREQARLLGAARHRFARTDAIASIRRASAPSARSIARRCRPRFAALHPFAGDRATAACRSPSGSALRSSSRSRDSACSGSGRRRELRRAASLIDRRRRFAIRRRRLATARSPRPPRRCRSRTLFVGHDSGPLHVAGAFGVPGRRRVRAGTARRAPFRRASARRA